MLSSQDEFSVLDESLDVEIEFDDDYVVHGGACDHEPTEESHRVPIRENLSHPWKAEPENCDAEDEQPPVTVRSRRSRKKRWCRNLLKTRALDFLVTARSANIANVEHAELVDKEGCIKLSRRKAKPLFPQLR